MAVFVFMCDVMVSEGIGMPVIRVDSGIDEFDPKKERKKKKTQSNRR